MNGPRITVGFIADRQHFLTGWTNQIDLSQVAATLREVSELVRTGHRDGRIHNDKGQLIGSWLLEEETP